MTNKKTDLPIQDFSALPPLGGVKMATAKGQDAYQGRDNYLLVHLAENTQIAGVFTKSALPAAPVQYCRENLRQSAGQARLLFVNAGNANACTGKKGHIAIQEIVASAARLFAIPPQTIYLASTGMIGKYLDSAPMIAQLAMMKNKLRQDGWEAGARAIMTTDAFAKCAHATVELGDETITINAIAKGAGMIAPNMATMLAFVFTDAKISAPVLQKLLEFSVRDSFNAMTVDGDMSTNDTVLLFATGAKGTRQDLRDLRGRHLQKLRAALCRVMQDLTCAIVMDGEGAKKHVTISVSGARSDRAARMVARSIGESPLVKTALGGEDPVWGRIAMAIGKAGEKLAAEDLNITICGQKAVCCGHQAPDFDEAALAQAMKQRYLQIAVEIGKGKGKARIWSCDLNQRYIEINADYRS